MRRKFLLIPLVIVLVTALIFGGCAKPAEEVPEEIIIGCVTSLTGPLAGAGGGSSWGLKAAVDDINKQGGVYVEEYGTKLPLKVVLVDSESTPAKFGTLAEDLILREDVDVITAAFEPPDFVAPLAVVAERYKVPHVSGAGPMEAWLGLRNEVTPPWKYTWAMGFSITTPAPPGDFRADNPGYLVMDNWLSALGAYADETNKKVGAFAEDDPDGRGWYLGYTARASEEGYDICGLDELLGLVPPATTDFTPLIQDWMDYDCDIIWGCSSAPFYGTLARQFSMMGFQPKMVFAAKSALFYTDIAAWGGNIPLGVSIEWWWNPEIKDSFGVGGTTPQSLYDRYHEATGEPLNQFIGVGYCVTQVIADAIERAGTLDKDEINNALGETDLMTIYHRIMFDKEDQWHRCPISFGQWQKVDKPEVWEAKIVFSYHDFIPVTGEFLFPIPYE